MKKRLDFVSNSSSSSFVVAIPNEKQYKFKDFVNDLVKDCSANKDQEHNMSDKELEALNAFNARNLDYHLNSSELLFLGTLKLKDGIYTTQHPSVKDKNYNDVQEYELELESFESLKKDVSKKNFGKYTGEKLIRSTDTEITVSYPVYVHGIAVPSMDMDNITMHYCFSGNETAEDRKHAYDNIMHLMNIVKDTSEGELYHFFNTSMYFISKKTIWNTHALIENGAEIDLEQWEDLDKLEKRLDEGQRLFVIRQNNGGDGWDNNAIYGLGGWDAKFGDKAAVEVIYSECM